MLLSGKAEAGQNCQTAPFEFIFRSDGREFRPSRHLPRHVPIGAGHSKCRDLGGSLPHNLGHGARAELARQQSLDFVA
jgi:hypothetical protein